MTPKTMIAATIIQKLALQTIAQFSSLPKGKRRDELTVTFWVGCWTALNEIEHPDAAWVGRVTQLLIGTRGYSEAADIAAKYHAEQEQTI